MPAADGKFQAAIRVSWAGICAAAPDIAARDAAGKFLDGLSCPAPKSVREVRVKGSAGYRSASLEEP